MDKVRKAQDLIEFFLNKKNKKVTVQAAQKLCGFLNFLCRCIIPGRAFLTRLYTLTPSKLLPHHHVWITTENRKDLEVWKIFLSNPQIYCRPFMDFREYSAVDIDMYSDASKNPDLGFGAYCQEEWCYGQWDKQFIQKIDPSIQYLELFVVTVAVLHWIHKFSNRRICLFCDNQSVVQMINKSSSSCKNYMVLIRLITLKSLVNNVRIFARYVPTWANDKADALSRLDLERFWRVCKDQDHRMAPLPREIPLEIWPIQKIWLGNS